MKLSQKFLALPFFFLLGLTSCAMFQGRETPAEYAEDTAITTKVKNAYVIDPVVKAMQVNVETMQGVVQLSGFVDSEKAEKRAVDIARGTKGVRGVKNDIIVRPN